jgi:hypothetical protein
MVYCLCIYLNHMDFNTSDDNSSATLVYRMIGYLQLCFRVENLLFDACSVDAVAFSIGLFLPRDSFKVCRQKQQKCMEIAKIPLRIGESNPELRGFEERLLENAKC